MVTAAARQTLHALGEPEADLDDLLVGLVDGADPVVVRPGARAARADVLAVLRLCAAGGLRCSEKTRRPAAASVAAVSEVLSQGDFYPDDAIAGFAWPLLLQAGSLAELSGGRLKVTPKGLAALTAPPEATVRQLWSRWLSGAVIDEMSRVEAIKGQHSARALTAAGPRRKSVGQALAACPPGGWLLIDDLFDWMRRSGAPMFSVARDPWNLYLIDRNYGSLGYEGYGDWPIIEGRYLLALLFEYAGTLGLFDLAYRRPSSARTDFRGDWGSDCLDYLSRYDGLLAVRLNNLGSYVFGYTPAFTPDEVEETEQSGPRTSTPLKVLATHDVVATGEVSAGQVLVLEAFGRQTSERVWTVHRESVLTAIAAGRRPAELRDFLQTHSTTGVPSTLLQLLDDAEARSRTVRNEGLVHLVACADAATAALIARDRKAGRYCRPIGTTHPAVPPEHEAKFRAALLVAG